MHCTALHCARWLPRADFDDDDDIDIDDNDYDDDDHHDDHFFSGLMSECRVAAQS